MITIKYSFLLNLSSLFETLRDKKWLDENGYIYNLDFLSLFRIESIRVNEIKKILNKIEVKNKSFIVYLHKFSTYGSYKLPNKIYLNIYQPLNEIKETFFHELKHLQVEKFVQKNKLSHQQKENLVNELMEEDRKKY